MMEHDAGCACSVCGAAIADLPIDFAYSLPDCVFDQPPSERSPRCNADFAEFGGRKFVRALLPVPVVGSEEFRYGVWIEVDQDDFIRIVQAWDDAAIYPALTFRGVLANAIEPFGAKTVGIEVEAATRAQNARPFVVHADAEWVKLLLAVGWSRSEYVAHAQAMIDRRGAPT